MDSDEFNFYESLSRYAIQPKLIELLPVKPQRIVPYYNDGYILESESGSLALWVHRGAEASLAYQIRILKICLQHNLPGFLYPLELTDGRNYAELNDLCWFSVTSWPKLQKVHFGYATDLKAIVELLAGFRKVIHENGFLFCLPERRDHCNLLKKFIEIGQQLGSFEILAKHRLRPTAFDRQFLLYLPEIMSQVKYSLEILKDTDYLETITKLTPQDIVVNKLTRHNLRIANNGKAICLQLDDYRWDIPIVDLAVFLIKTGRSFKWDSNWYQMILQEYERYFKISPSEHQFIHAYISFPWSFYRLASRYYYNRVNWPLRTFVEKMTRLLDDEPNRIRFIHEYSKID